jgi:hypothetical protein
MLAHFLQSLTSCLIYQMNQKEEMKVLKLSACIFLSLSIMIFTACSDTTSSGGGGDTGALSLSLTDASTDDYKAVYVTIDKIQVHRGDADGKNWITVATPKTTYNLLELVNGVLATLGKANLEPGIYTQIRLYLGHLAPEIGENILGDRHPFPNYVVDSDDDDIHELKVPSGYQTGIKLVRKFEIVAGLTVDLVLDFDAPASVVKAGKSGQYILKPTIKVIDTVKNAIVNGIVFDDQQIGLEGATVSAQIYKQSFSGVKDQVLIYTSTIAAGDDKDNNAGEYLMYLPPGTYNIVAYKPGFKPECRNIITELDDVLTENFHLTAASETVFITVAVDAPADGQSVLISFRQTCGREEIEVASLNVLANETDYEILLPEGEYLVVASTEGMETFESHITIVEGIPVALDINFSRTPFSPIPI